MSGAFEHLSREGKFNKIREHLESPLGYPVPAPWVEWLLGELGTIMPKKDNDWHPVGDICIDTGTLLLCDPVHAQVVSDTWDPHRAIRGGTVCGKLRDDPPGNVANASLAISIPTGIGDGFYRVMARCEEVPGFGRRIAEVNIKFLPHPGPWK